MRWTWLVLVLLVPAAFGQFDDSWSEQGRTLTGTWDRDGFTFTSVRDGEPHDAFTITYDHEAAEVQLAHNTSAIDATLQWRGVFEFQDLDGDGSYSLGDPIIHQVRMDEMTPQRVVVDELEGGRYEITSAFRYGSFPYSYVTLTWHLVSTYAAAEGPLQAPMTVAMDVAIEDHEFATDNQTRLALEMRWLQAMDGGNSLSTTREDIQLRQSWGAALVDGITLAPGVTSHRYGAGTATQEVLLLNWPRADQIEQSMALSWHRIEDEPDLPEVILQDLAGRWYLYLVGLGLAGLLVYLPIRMREAA